MYDINNELKQKIRLYISRKRCDRCFSSFEKNCLIYFCDLQLFQEKTRFALERKPTQEGLSSSFRQPFARSLITNTGKFVKSFSGSRSSCSPNKERYLRRVLSIEIYCSKCTNFRLMEIDLDGFLSKSFNQAGAIRAEEEQQFYEEEESD